MKLHRFLYFLSLLYCTPLLQAQQSPHVLTLFFKPALVQFCEGDACDFLSHLHLPGQTNRIILGQKIMAKIIGGLYVSYGGYVAVSDINGEVSFPLTQTEDAFTIIVTDAIKPVLLFSNTVNHLELMDNNPVAWYSYKKMIDAAKKPHWVIEKLAPQRKIPDNAIIIFSQPAHIIIAPGTYKAEEGPHAILPHIYVTDATPLEVNALQFVKVAKFFAPVMKTFGYAHERYADIIAN